ncbi:hypothetical protein [Nocardioides sp.]|uniref:hypothetical protein n=1 Tax=Nocardioides sp. TaxID=35761 RepID=UPI0026095144|nr:hypothetical protein [Nocardioides sp.]
MHHIVRRSTLLRLSALVTLLTVPPARRGQRGDVPGWVLVTVMTAGLVAALYSIADDQLRALLTSALNKVS